MSELKKYSVNGYVAGLDRGDYYLASEVDHLVEAMQTAMKVERLLRFAICPGCTKGIVWGPRDSWVCSDVSCGLEGYAHNFLADRPVYCPHCCGDLAAPTALVKNDAGRVHCEVCKWPKPPVRPDNLHAPMMDVRHGDLKRFSDDSPHKSDCPVCPGGVLLMQRDRRTHELIDVDRCIGCGQAVRYTDLAEMKRARGTVAGDTKPDIQFAFAACDDCGFDIHVHSTATDRAPQDHESWFANEGDKAECGTCGAKYVVDVSSDGIGWLEHVSHGLDHKILFGKVIDLDPGQRRVVHIQPESKKENP